MSRTRRAGELAIVLVLYIVLAMGASWPLVRDFSTRLIGDVSFDQRHAVWMLWHVKEALFGRQPWFTADLLFHPHGVSTLVDGVGPVSGVLALPFWTMPFSSGGPVAAYNGATLLGFSLSGWCMYLLVRYGGTSGPWGLGGVPRLAAFSAGAVFMMWPIHVAGLYGHLEKAFVGLLPLNVLAGLLAYDPARSRRWLVAPAVALLLVLLHNANQFTFALLALVLLAGLGFVTRAPDTGQAFIARVLASGAIAIVVTAPLLIELAPVVRDQNMAVSLGIHSAYYAPDLLQLVVPSIHQAIGAVLYPAYDIVTFDFTRESAIAALSPRADWYGSGIETAVSIPVTVVLLAVVAWAGHRRGTRLWLFFSGIFALLALGPVLRIAGMTTIPLPYRVLASVPGFDVMRTPGRLMMIASVGFAIVAAFGLATLMARESRRAHLVAALMTAVVLIECWPRPWPQQVPPPVPVFYTRLAQDGGSYAVLDLPSGRRTPSYASAYQYYQLTHGKPIAWGYLSRDYVQYPVAGLSGILEDDAPDAAGTRERLAGLGYRYLVWHKRAGDLFAGRRPETLAGGPFRSAPVVAQSSAFLQKAFAGERPIVDDDLVTVYRVYPVNTQ